MTSSYLGERIVGALRDPEARRASMDRLHRENAERVVETMGRLKGAAMKIGQSVAMLAGSMELPEEVRASLGRLHDKVEPVDFSVIREELEASLERPLEQAFSTLDPQPLGTASLGQAHLARLPDGAEVVVKVLHRGIEHSVASDLAALKAMLIGGRVLRRDRAEIDAIFDEIQARLEEELDYLQEAANIQCFREMYRDNPAVRIPAVHTAWSTERVLTLDRLPGLPLEEFLLVASPEARQRAGVTLATLFYEQVYRHRTLHADPHPGNYLFELDGRVGLLDFGCVKRFDEFWIAHYARAALSAIVGDKVGCLAACRGIGSLVGAGPEAEDALWDFCDLLASPYRRGRYRLGGPDDDDLFRKLPVSVARLVQHPAVSSPRDLVFLHRALGGLYTLERRLQPELDWRPLLEQNARYAVALAEGMQR